MTNFPSIFTRTTTPRGLRPRTQLAKSLTDAAGSLVEVLEPRQMMAADLGIAIGDAFAPLAFYVPGESVTVPFAVRNNGIDAFTGKASVRVKLTTNNSNIDPPLEVSSLPAVVTMTNVAADGTVTGNVTFVFTSDLDGYSFDVSLEVTPQTSAGVNIEDEWLDDNTVQSDQGLELEYVAGNYGGRTGLVMRLEDADGTDFTVAMTGGGYAQFDDGVDSGNPAGLYLWGVNGMLNSAQPAQTLSVTYIADTDTESDDTINFDDAGLGVFDGIDTIYSNLRLAAIVAPNLTLSTMTLASIQSGVVATPTAITLRDIKPSFDFGEVSIGRPVGAFTVRDITGIVNINNSAGAIRVNNITEGSLTVDGLITSLTAQDLTFASVSVNFEGTANRTAVPITLRDVSDSSVVLNLQLSTVTVRKWLTAEGFPASGNYLAARAIGTLTVGPAPTTADPTSGNFFGDVFVIGGINRPTQLGTVNIAGVLAGSLFVNGSVGAVTARTVNSGSFADPTASSWTPTMAVNGSVLSFTCADVITGAIWANSIRTANLTVASSERNFEIAAGFRATQSTFFSFSGSQILNGSSGDGSDAATFRSGLIGTLNLTLRPTVTGFTGRFAAGLNANSDPASYRDINGSLDFAAAADFGSLLTPRIDTGSRINTINVTGVISSATITNSLQFAAITYGQTARFNVGNFTGTSGALIPSLAANATPTAGAINSSVATAGMFFRIGRPA